MEFNGFENGDLVFLPKDEYKAVLRDMREIVASNSPLYIGERLFRLQRTLAPYGYFIKAIKAMRLVLRTAYGYMYGYRNACEQLPAGAVEAMMKRKLTINASRNKTGLGEWTAAIKLMPPPSKGSATTYERWVEEMIAAKPKRLTGQQALRVPRNPSDVLRECYVAVDRLARRLPPDRRIKETTARKLIALIMKRFDLGPEKFVPAEIPSHFVEPRNRFSQHDAVA